jgi:hypothetical protein
MQKVVIIGNCQATALEMMLSTNSVFRDRFEFVSFPPVHEMPVEQMPLLHSAVANADIVVPQRIDESYRDGMGLGTKTLTEVASTDSVVRWPSVYWAGYFPDLFYLRNAAGAAIHDGPFDYHDRVILRAFAAGVDVTGACVLLEAASEPSNAPAWAAHATAELDIRGEDCDIEVASFIGSHFREELLFFTMNHPTNRMLAYMAQQITELLEIPGRVDPRQMPGEVLGATFYPLHTNHVRALDLQFGEQARAGRTSFRLRGESYEPVQAVSAFYGFYEANPELVQANLDPVGQPA